MSITVPKSKGSQKKRFLLVGITATAIDFGLLFLLQGPFRLPVLSSNIVSTTTAFAFSFIANKNYTFRSDGGNILRQMVLFAVVTLFGLWVIQSMVIWLAMPIINNLTSNSDTALLVAKLGATGVTMVWNYLLYSSLVFPNSPSIDEKQVQ